MFEVPGSDVKTVHITEDCVRGVAAPEYIRHNSSTTQANDVTTSNVSSVTDDEESAQVRVKQ